MKESTFKSYVVNRPAFDWLTVTTYDKQLYLEARAWVMGLPMEEEWSPSSHLQYVGDRNEGVFVGWGRQNDVLHYIVILSGSICGWMGQELLDMGDGGWNVTRFDVQVTVPRPIGYDAFQLMRLLRYGGWYGSGNTPTVGIVSMNDTGDDTVYIGSPKSARRWRVYVKDREYVRWEYTEKGWGKGDLQLKYAVALAVTSLYRFPVPTGAAHAVLAPMMDDVTAILERGAEVGGVLVTTHKRDTRRVWFDMLVSVFEREARKNDGWFSAYWEGLRDKVDMALMSR